MDLKEIMSVSGYSGLFKFVSQGRNGIIVESFSDQKRMFVNTNQKVSSLADIAIFTEEGEVPLKDVFKKIHESQPGEQAPDSKSDPEELKKFLEKVLPEYDRNRVYVSDIRKLVTWYNSLLAMAMVSFEEEKPADSTEVKSEDEQPEQGTEQPEAAEPKTQKQPKTAKSSKPAAKPKTPKKEQ